jgi:hypothetical protein
VFALTNLETSGSTGSRAWVALRPLRVRSPLVKRLSHQRSLSIAHPFAYSLHTLTLSHRARSLVRTAGAAVLCHVRIVC